VLADREDRSLLISVDRLRRYWGIEAPSVIIHIGAHEAEELGDYDRLGWGREHTVWVEALPEKAAIVRRKTASRPNHVVVEAVLWDESGESIDFTEMSNGQSSSAFEPKDQLTLYPDITVKTVRKFTTSVAADVIPFDDLGEVGMVLLDIQGAELQALKGFRDRIGRVRAIYSEVSRRELYEGGASFGTLDAWLAEHGFTLVDSEILWRVGWGDALWLRAEDVPADAASRRRRRRFADLPQQARFFAWWLLKGRRKH